MESRVCIIGNESIEGFFELKRRSCGVGRSVVCLHCAVLFSFCLK